MNKINPNLRWLSLVILVFLAQSPLQLRHVSPSLSIILGGVLIVAIIVAAWLLVRGRRSH